MDRKAMGTALHTREIVDNLLKIKRPEDEIYLVHRKKYDHPLYNHPEINEIVMPKVPTPRLANVISEAIFLWKTRNDFDVIHYTQEAIYPLFWLSNAKIVVTIHSAAEGWRDYAMRIRWWLVYLTFKIFKRRLDAIISVSETTRKSFQSYFNIPREKIHVIREGVIEAFRDRHDRLASERLASEKYNIRLPYIFNGSRVDPQKNIPGLIKAFAKLKKDHNIPHQLVVGPKHWPKKEVKRVDGLIENLKLEEDVVFIKYVEEEDMPSLYFGSDLFVYPSLHEGFGLPLLEAMAAGVPIVTGNTFSMPEIAGDAALLADPYDPSDIASAMWKVLDDAKLKRELVRRGNARVKNFGWNKMTGEIFELYKQLV
ncbi:MAG: glycosyltransferase family 1 protein [bacterium]|nr:glycosyltransferase family 1 protein [bacterium]